MVMPEGRGYRWGWRWGRGSGRGGDNEDGGVGERKKCGCDVNKHACSMHGCVRMGSYTVAD